MRARWSWYTAGLSGAGVLLALVHVLVAPVLVTLAGVTTGIRARRLKESLAVPALVKAVVCLGLACGLDVHNFMG